MVLVKICGITNLADALAAVEAGADALGFNFYRRSPRYIASVEARGIIEQLPAGVLSVGVYVNEAEPETVARLAAEACVGAIQLHGDETPDYCRVLRESYVIKALRVDESFEPDDALEYETRAVLLDAFSAREYGGTGKAFDWSVAQRVGSLVPKLFLAGGLKPENVAEAIAVVRPYAVDACSSLEVSPGRKDAGRVRAFVRAVRGAC